MSNFHVLYKHHKVSSIFLSVLAFYGLLFVHFYIKLQQLNGTLLLNIYLDVACTQNVAFVEDTFPTRCLLPPKLQMRRHFDWLNLVYLLLYLKKVLLDSIKICQFILKLLSLTFARHCHSNINIDSKFCMQVYIRREFKY